MKESILDSASHVAKTVIFFLFVGGLVGTVFTVPFVEELSHRPFRIPDSLYILLLGYIVVGMPVAAFTGFLYGIGLAFFLPNSLSRTILAIGCGIVTAMVIVAIWDIWNPRNLADSMIMISSLMLFSGFSSLVTAWIHRKAELRFNFLHATRNSEEADG